MGLRGLGSGRLLGRQVNRSLGAGTSFLVACLQTHVGMTSSTETLAPCSVARHHPDALRDGWQGTCGPLSSRPLLQGSFCHFPFVPGEDQREQSSLN